MTVEWGCFWRGRKKLDSEMPFIPTSFRHSNIIPFWWELLTLIEIGMSLNGVEWHLNDLIWCCLLLGDSTGLNHSDLISLHSTVSPVWSLILSLDWDWNELEWRGMRSEWFNLVLSPIRRQHRIKSFRPHSTSFHCHSSLSLRRKLYSVGMGWF